MYAGAHSAARTGARVAQRMNGKSLGHGCLDAKGISARRRAVVAGRIHAAARRSQPRRARIERSRWLRRDQAQDSISTYSCPARPRIVAR